jgi:ATP-dependent Clp protease adaptor protein ClpS
MICTGIEILEPEIDEEVLADIDLDELIDEEKQIIIYNDDVNTFQHVIGCLIKYCKHNELQAEQCAHIIHNNGKCSVKGGSYTKLKPIHEALLENGLNSKIE